MSKLVPVMTTVVPGTPLPGVNPVTVGGKATMKSVALVAVPRRSRDRDLARGGAGGDVGRQLSRGVAR